MTGDLGRGIPETVSGRDALWLVTGATGVIGPSIVDAVVDSGARVRVLTRHQSSPAGWSWRSEDGCVEIVHGDARDAVALGIAMKGVDVVVHGAGLAHQRPDTRDALQAFTDENVDSARAVADAASAAGVIRVVFISSAAVYGPANGERRNEATPTRPTTAYGRSKLEAERLMQATLGDALTVLRVCAVYGPRLRGQYGVLARAVRSRWPVPVVDGHGHCLITDADLAHVVTRLGLDPLARGAVLNVSDGCIYTVSQIVAAQQAAVGVQRWQTPILPRLVGTGSVRLLALSGGREWTRRRRGSDALRSLVDGPALDITALQGLLPGWRCQSLVDGWATALPPAASLHL